MQEQNFDRLNEIIQQAGKPHLSLKEASDYLNLTPSYLYKLTHLGLIPCYKPSGKKLVFLKAELNKWLMQNPIKTKDQIEQEAIDRVTFKKVR